MGRLQFLLGICLWTLASFGGNANAQNAPYEPYRINIVVHKKSFNDRTVYRFDKTDQAAQSSGNGEWNSIIGSNYKNGEISFFTAYESSWEKNKDSLGRYKSGGFEQRIAVCTDPTTGGDVMLENGCSSQFSFKFNFYAASGSRPGTVRIDYGRARDDSDPRHYYGAVAKEGQAGYLVPEGLDYAGDHFYAYPGVDKRCQFPRPINAFIDQISYSRGLVSPLRFDNRCNRGYETADGESSVTYNCNVGFWDKAIKQCQKINCGEPDPIQNGQYEGNDHTFQSRLVLRCNENFKQDPPFSHSQIICEEDGWSDPFVNCVPKQCPLVAGINNGHVIGVSRIVGSDIYFACDPGFRLRNGPSMVTCNDDERWSSHFPICWAIQCPYIRPSPGLHFTQQGDRRVGTTVTAICGEEYIQDGDSVLKCEQNGDEGDWDKVPPTCTLRTCDPLSAPENGRYHNYDPTNEEKNQYGAEVYFSCNEGYFIQGARKLRCGIEGWSSTQPICEPADCGDPGTPRKGGRNGTDFTFGNTVYFNCPDGYELEGPSSTYCGANGRWTVRRTPECVEIGCDALPQLENGARTSHFDEAHDRTITTFTCHPGYHLTGDNMTICGTDGEWDLEVFPTCIICPRDTYKEEPDNSECINCPERSYTATDGSSSRHQCMCERGTIPTEDGSGCLAVSCDTQEAPENGQQLSDTCDTEDGSRCEFTCNPGYTLSGSRVRVCSGKGWSGSPPTCTACGLDEYKFGEKTCIPCPSRTTNNGQPGDGIESCVCREGYRRDAKGKCEDHDECKDPDVPHPCQQGCRNIPGSLECYCTIAGYKPDPDNPSKCVKVQTCSQLSQDLENGKLECEYHENQNSAQCEFHCDPGYAIVSGRNNYVTCGSTTRFVWSHQIQNRTARLPACTEELYVDIRLPVVQTFQTDQSCDDFEIKYQSSIRESLIEIYANLDEDVCTEGRCEAIDLQIVCEILDDGTNQVKVYFNLWLYNFNNDKIGADCTQACVNLNLREMFPQVNVLRKAVVDLSEEITVVDEDTGSFILKPLDDKRLRTVTGKPEMICPPGEILTSHRRCVPCDAGYYLPPSLHTLNNCSLCPVGTYQIYKGQTSCTPCPKHSTTAAAGAYHPTMCSVEVPMTTYVNTTAEAEASKRRRRRSIKLYNDEKRVEDMSLEELEEFLDIFK